MTLVLAEPLPELVESAQDERTADPYSLQANSETFDLDGYLARFPSRLLADAEGRKILTRLDPLLFAIVYMRKHLRDGLTGQVTFADSHFMWVQEARDWLRPITTPRQHRRAYVAPRACGKTTWWFLVLPMWAAAHGHARFIAAFADSGAQSELHLATFKRELSDNVLLRNDYPDLCEPARRHNGKTVNDSQQMLYTKSGFAFSAKGIDSTSLGLKVDQHRPDVILFDDIEPDESNYSEYQITKRLRTIQDAILPLNEFARVVLIGTVTMPGSIVHQLVRYRNEGFEDDDELPDELRWIHEEKFETHHTLPIPVRDDGTERSVWPAKWSLGYLQSIRHTRSYKKNFANDPMGVDGGYWSELDFTYGELDGAVGELLTIDPSITTKKRSDWAGLSIISYIPPRSGYDDRGHRTRLPAKCVVQDAWEVRKVGAALRGHVLHVLARRQTIRMVLVEANQGGENWYDTLRGLPVPLRIVWATEPKEVRAANTLNHYQHGLVLHARKILRLEEQMVAFPRAAHDDLVDSVGAGVKWLLSPKPRGDVVLSYPR